MLKKATIAIICIFVFLRPIFTMSYFVDAGFMGLKLIEVYGIGSSYFFILLIVFNLGRMKIDGVSLCIAFFCCYMLTSVLWGSTFHEVAKLIMPFMIFFLVRSLEMDSRQLKKILLFLVTGFQVPVLISFLLIIMGKSGDKTIYKTGLTRFSGAFANIHSNGHSMFAFIVALSLLYFFYLDNTGRNFKKRIILMCLSLPALFNLYKSYVRTVYVGLALFSSVYIVGRRKYLLMGLGFIVMLIVVVKSSTFQTIFFDVVDPLQGKGKIGQMGSGRIEGWSLMVDRFLNATFVDQIKGFGTTVQSTLTNSQSFGGSHSDFISVMVCFGYIGLLLYLSIYFSFFMKVFFSRTNREIKSIYVGFILSIGAMNFLSNSYLARFELAQYFCLFIGMFYSFEKQFSQSRQATEAQRIKSRPIVHPVMPSKNVASN